jgi:hypothetical protein
MGQQIRSAKEQGLPTILPEIRSLIEVSRHHAAITANLALVNLYWNVGRIIMQDIQKNEKRAGYGEQLLESLAASLTREYGKGYSRASLQDMRRFFETFKICQTVSNEFDEDPIHQTLSSELPTHQILRTVSGDSSGAPILQALPVESPDHILIDLRDHFHLGWSHYRLLLSKLLDQ